MNKRFKSMREELIHSAEREAMRLWRLARKAEKKGVSQRTINTIREEAHIMYTTMTAYPERLLSDNFQYEYQYAFKCEYDTVHTYDL